jgi:hypothetical protein
MLIEPNYRRKKMIPKVRRWKVKYHMPNGEVREIIVRTINKNFAQWEARDILGYTAWMDADKITVSPN